MTSRLVITAHVRYLVVVRRFVQEAAHGLGASQRVTDDLIQAVDELAANIILHGYRDAAGEFEVEVRPEGNGLAVVLRDQAPVFDPATAGEPNLDVPLEDRQVGGLGIYLSRKLTDEMRHRARPGGGNELTLVKRNLHSEA
jgi:serine/threonine-protein kinase RsbW